jgi:hypothetical protein
VFGGLQAVGSRRLSAWVVVAALCAACGGSEPARRPPPQIRRAEQIAIPDAQFQQPPASAAHVKIKGITGSLNPDDVHQTMESRQSAFDSCIEMSRRSLRWVSGAIRFAFRVDAEGKVQEVHTIESTIGHRTLEACLSSVMAQTQFPKPAGHATAQFTWGMSVEPIGAAPKPIEATLLKRVLQKKTREVFETCSVRRRRERFRVTAYIAPGGRVVSAGAVPVPPRAEDKLDCVLEQVASWHMPKLDHSGKVSFELR